TAERHHPAREGGDCQPENQIPPRRTGKTAAANPLRPLPRSRVAGSRGPRSRFRLRPPDRRTPSRSWWYPDRSRRCTVLHRPYLVLPELDFGRRDDGATCRDDGRKLDAGRAPARVEERAAKRRLPGHVPDEVEGRSINLLILSDCDSLAFPAGKDRLERHM